MSYKGERMGGKYLNIFNRASNKNSLSSSGIHYCASATAPGTNVVFLRGMGTASDDVFDFFRVFGKRTLSLITRSQITKHDAVSVPRRKISELTPQAYNIQETVKTYTQTNAR